MGLCCSLGLESLLMQGFAGLWGDHGAFCSPALLVAWRWYRSGEGKGTPVSFQPRVTLINLSHIVVTFSLYVPPHSFHLYYYYFYYNNCVFDWVGVKRQHCDVGKCSFSPQCERWLKMMQNEWNFIDANDAPSGRETQCTVLFEQQSGLYSSFVVPLKTHSNRTERHRKANCAKKTSGINRRKIFRKKHVKTC